MMIWGKLQRLSGDQLRILLQGIDVDFILKSLIYNVETVKRYKSKTKAKRYATVIGQFFNYIRRTTDIVNTDLYDAISYNRLRENSYMQQMMVYIDKCEMLAGIVEQEPLTSTEAEKILIWANEQFTVQEWENATSFKKSVAAVGIKMMVLYGITYRELRKMKWDDYDEVYDCITVNGFELRLPLKLSIQLRNIKDFVFDKKIVNREKLMFAGFRGEAWNDITSSSGIPDYMGALIGITSVTSVVKYGIEVRLSPLYDNSSSLCAYVAESKINQYLGNDLMLWKSLVDTKSKSIIRISCRDTKQPTHLEVIKYIHKNYLEQTIDIVKKIKELLTEDAICMVVDKYVETLSMNKIDLIKRYLFSKVQLLKEVYGDVDYEY